MRAKEVALFAVGASTLGIALSQFSFSERRGEGSDNLQSSNPPGIAKSGETLWDNADLLSDSEFPSSTVLRVPTYNEAYPDNREDPSTLFDLIPKLSNTNPTVVAAIHRDIEVIISISGPSGFPLTGLEMTAMPNDRLRGAPNASPDHLYKGRTDENGRFTLQIPAAELDQWIHNLQIGSNEIALKLSAAGLTGYRLSRDLLQIPLDTENGKKNATSPKLYEFSLTLERVGRPFLSGTRVLDPDGLPIPSATIKVKEDDEVRVGITSADGLIKDLLHQPGVTLAGYDTDSTGLVTVYASGYLPQCLEVDLGIEYGEDIILVFGGERHIDLSFEYRGKKITPAQFSKITTETHFSDNRIQPFKSDFMIDLDSGPIKLPRFGSAESGLTFYKNGQKLLEMDNATLAGLVNNGALVIPLDREQYRLLRSP